MSSSSCHGHGPSLSWRWDLNGGAGHPSSSSWLPWAVPPAHCLWEVFSCRTGAGVQGEQQAREGTGRAPRHHDCVSERGVCVPVCFVLASELSNRNILSPTTSPCFWLKVRAFIYSFFNNLFTQKNHCMLIVSQTVFQAPGLQRGGGYMEVPLVGGDRRTENKRVSPRVVSAVTPEWKEQGLGAASWQNPCAREQQWWYFWESCGRLGWKWNIEWAVNIQGASVLPQEEGGVWGVWDLGLGRIGDRAGWKVVGYAADSGPVELGAHGGRVGGSPVPVHAD